MVNSQSTWQRLNMTICLLMLLTGLASRAELPLKIAMSKESRNYITWLKRLDSTVIIINLYPLKPENLTSVLSECDALLITGGDDLYPGLYGMESEISRCTETDRRRDSLEYTAIRTALHRRIPILGICRGMQILNIYFGGTLIIDIPSDYPSAIKHQCDDYLKCFHSAYPVTTTMLARITGSDSAVVTTNHHQAVKNLAPQLKVNAYSADRLVEGIEWADPTGKSFMIGVQWHPERMPQGNPLSDNIGKEFLQQARDAVKKP